METEMTAISRQLVRGFKGVWVAENPHTASAFLEQADLSTGRRRVSVNYWDVGIALDVLLQGDVEWGEWV